MSTNATPGGQPPPFDPLSLETVNQVNLVLMGRKPLPVQEETPPAPGTRVPFKEVRIIFVARRGDSEIIAALDELSKLHRPNGMLVLSTDQWTTVLADLGISQP